MIKIYHIVKPSNRDTKFRQAILQALDSVRYSKQKIQVSIASGFFNEIVQHPKIPVSQFVDAKIHMNMRNVVKNMDIDIYGAYDGKNGLVRFAQNLKNAGANVKVFYKNKFHSKLFVIQINNKVVFEIIGSSNMTVAAYEGLKKTKKSTFKYSDNSECDLILVDDSGVNCEIDIDEYTMRFSYDSKENNGIELETRMNDVIKQLESLKMAGKMKDITSELI